jgi:hypothetical protein
MPGRGVCWRTSQHCRRTLFLHRYGAGGQTTGKARIHATGTPARWGYLLFRLAEARLDYLQTACIYITRAAAGIATGACGLDASTTPGHEPRVGRSASTGAGYHVCANTAGPPGCTPRPAGAGRAVAGAPRRALHCSSLKEVPVSGGTGPAWIWAPAIDPSIFIAAELPQSQRCVPGVPALTHRPPHHHRAAARRLAWWYLVAGVWRLPLHRQCPLTNSLRTKAAAKMLITGLPPVGWGY